MFPDGSVVVDLLRFGIFVVVVVVVVVGVRDLDDEKGADSERDTAAVTPNESCC